MVAVRDALGVYLGLLRTIVVFLLRWPIGVLHTTAPWVRQRIIRHSCFMPQKESSMTENERSRRLGTDRPQHGPPHLSYLVMLSLSTLGV